MMKKVNLILLFIGLALVVSSQNKPNILWLTFEDTSPQFIGCYGNSSAKTPVIDKLAEEGVRFTSAFSTGTVCSPSRFTLITGCRTTKYSTGHHRSKYSLPENIEAFPKYLRDAGYYTSNNNKTDYNTQKQNHFIKTGWYESSSRAGWWKRKPGQPFFSVFNIFSSHQSRTMTNPWWKYKEQILDNLESETVIGNNDFDVPPIFNDTPEMRKQLSRIYNAIQLCDIQIGEVLGKLEKDGLVDSTIVFCFADHGEGMPWGKTFSRGMGYRVPFVIYFPEMYKHLSPWGTNVVSSDVVDFSDLPATVLSLAGIEVPEYMDGRSLIGTQAEKAKKYMIGGLDRSGENTGLSRSISDGKFIYNKHFMPFQPENRWQKYFDYGKIAILIRKDFKNGDLDKVQASILETGNAETLFNLESDPWETINLAQNHENKAKVQELESALKKDLIEKRDAHFIPEYTLKKEQSIPYDLSRNNEFYPAKEVIELAFQCGDKSALKKQLKALNHKNEIVRYWAAVGVYSHFTLYGYSEELSLSADSYPPSDIFIQATKAQFCKAKDAEDKLLNYISGDNEQLGILAAQLVCQPKKIDEDLLKRILKACKSSEITYVKQWGELLELKYLGKPLEMVTFW
jgi:arylsulfatase A-like enzyme